MLFLHIQTSLKDGAIKQYCAHYEIHLKNKGTKGKRKKKCRYWIGCAQNDCLLVAYVPTEFPLPETRTVLIFALNFLAF